MGCHHTHQSGERLNLKDIQELSLSMLLDVHEFCVKNGITYSIAYGTLIGAIRHKGFIPWDDDVDIVMPRKDFERFCREYKSQRGYKALSPSSAESLITFGRVYDAQSTRGVTTAPWSSFEAGVYIDVFPLDGVEDDNEVFKARIHSLRHTAFKIAKTRTSLQGFWVTKSIRRKLTWIVKRLLIMGTDFNKLRSVYLNEIQRYDFDSSNFYGQLGCYDSDTHKEHNPKEDFIYCVEVEFEGHKLLAMNGYDSTLRRYYGDYMKLPPVEQQQSGLNNYVEYYWK